MELRDKLAMLYGKEAYLDKYEIIHIENNNGHFIVCNNGKHFELGQYFVCFRVGGVAVIKPFGYLNEERVLLGIDNGEVQKTKEDNYCICGSCDSYYVNLVIVDNSEIKVYDFNLQLITRKSFNYKGYCVVRGYEEKHGYREDKFIKIRDANYDRVFEIKDNKIIEIQNKKRY